MLPFVNCQAPDSRVTKEEIALVFALSIGLLAIFHGEIKSFRNKFLLAIPVYLLFNLIMAPHIPLFINNNEVGDFYFWKPFGEVLCFALMVTAIASMEFSSEVDAQDILKIMVICGAVMAGYVILQKLGLDQFWQPKTDYSSLCVRGQVLGGNLGQPTVLASWLIMMIPLAIYLKKWWMATLMTLACILTQGAMVMIALAVIAMALLIRWKLFLIIPIMTVMIWGGFFAIHSSELQSKIILRMDGRYEVWKDTLKDIHNGQASDNKKFSITGIGLGRFGLIFPSKHNIPFQQAHNDLLEFTYNCGLIGLGLLLAGLGFMFMGALMNLTPICFSILLSFIGIFVCSLGSFPFQLGAHQFYSAVLVGLLNNEKIIRRA